MSDIIQTDRGVYDVSTIEGCYHYLCAEAGLSGRSLAMVKKLYAEANEPPMLPDHQPIITAIRRKRADVVPIRKREEG